MKKNFTTRTTNRLFYRKYPYKVEFVCRGINFFARMSKKEQSRFILQKGVPKWLNGPLSRHLIDVNAVHKFVFTLLHYFNDPNIKRRAEGSCISFFVEDQAEYKKLMKEGKEWLWEVTEPETPEDIVRMGAAKHTIVLCKDGLPHNGHKYKIRLKWNTDLATRINFRTWMEKYPGKFKPSPRTKNWLYGGAPYLTEPFVYVADDSLLTMCRMFLGDNMRRIDEFVLK